MPQLAGFTTPRPTSPPSAKESTTHLVLSDLREFLGCPEGGIELLLLRGEKRRIERVEKQDERRRRARDGTHGRASKSEATQKSPTPHRPNSAWVCTGSLRS